ncbi:alpha/beta hydrolase [Shewanella sp. Scap07]|uniref:alpha/beta fold hydrolase n=1 Tax=Shewanella sp. Scap07 TaxID=2589987 RepID=UPI0015BC1CB8|nr:alpha/beta hydrolase [Shewanella sp. Scap07]QLE84453.1 alpha/beta hydrolase [Shewanella sp. Scap07]
MMQVVLLRGLMRDQRHWHGFEQRLIDAGCQVLSVDVLGNGHYYRQRSPLNIDEYAEQVARQIQAHFQGQSVPQLTIVGLSMGGMIALRLAKQQPQMIKQVVLLNSSAANLSGWYQRFRLDRLIAIGAAQCWRHVIQQLNARGSAKKASPVERLVLALTSLKAANQIDYIQQWSQWRTERHCHFFNGVRQIIACAKFNAPSALSCPIYVMVANQDALVMPSCSAALAQFYQTELVKIDCCGHDISLDQPQILLRKLLQYQ